MRALGGRSGQTTAWSIANVVVATGVGMITARALGVELRGTLALMLSVAGLVVLLAALGTNVAIRRRLPQGQTTVAQYLRVSGVMFAGLLAAAPITAFMLGWWVDPAFWEAPVAIAFTVYAVSFFWSNQLLDLLNALGKIPLSAATNVAGTAVCLVAVSASVVLGGGLVPIALSYSVSMVVQILLAAMLVRRVAPPPQRRDESNWALVRDGSLMLGLNLGQAITYRADAIIIGALSSPYAVGLYAVATTPAALLRLPATAVGQVLLHDSATGVAGWRHVWKRVAQVELLLALLAAVGWLLADFLIVLLFGSAFADAAGVFRVLLLAELALAPFLILSRVLVGLGGTWHASVPGVVGATTLITVGIALIPQLGAYGGAWASLVAYAAMSLTTAVQLLIRGRTRSVAAGS